MEINKRKGKKKKRKEEGRGTDQRAGLVHFSQ